jgi:transcriptional regulator GlxA family with amidase domain
LLQIATYCYVSPFHFSRLFKTFTSVSPHQYLLTLRLKNAELLLRNTAHPMADIAFTSGFNSVEHFTAAFKQKYNCPPATYRQQAAVPS